MMKQIVGVLAIFALFSCSKSDDTGSDCGIYPLKLGNYWVFKNTYYNASGGIDSTKNSVVRLQNTTTYSGRSYFTIDSFYYPLRNKNCDTLVLLNKNTNTEINVVATGQSNDSLIYNLPHGTGTPDCRGVRIFSNKDRTVVGGYDCFKVEFQFTSCSGEYYRKRYYYVNEKVGLIKTEAYNTEGQQPVLVDRSELVSYSLK